MSTFSYGASSPSRCVCVSSGLATTVVTSMVGVGAAAAIDPAGPGPAESDRGDLHATRLAAIARAQATLRRGVLVLMRALLAPRPFALGRRFAIPRRRDRARASALFLFGSPRHR